MDTCPVEDHPDPPTQPALSPHPELPGGWGASFTGLFPVNPAGVRRLGQRAGGDLGAYRGGVGECWGPQGGVSGTRVHTHVRILRAPWVAKTNSRRRRGTGTPAEWAARLPAEPPLGGNVLSNPVSGPDLVRLSE